MTRDDYGSVQLLLTSVDDGWWWESRCGMMMEKDGREEGGRRHLQICLRPLEEGASEAGDMEGGYEDLCIYVGRAFLDYIVLSRGFKLQARLRPRSQ